MRTFIGFLWLIMVVLICNTLAYIASEDYRFFLKKIKYKQEIVYDEEVQVDDEQRVTVIEDETGKPSVYVWQQWITFLEALSRKAEEVETLEEDELVALSEDEEIFLEKFSQRYVLTQEQSPLSLFGLTTEYPDEYYDYSNKHLNIYIFSTKNYEEVKDIFEVLTYELPYSINEVNNFWESSFYINLDSWYEDDWIRIVLQYKKRAFWLKIKKDNYNRVKEILTQL